VLVEEVVRRSFEEAVDRLARAGGGRMATMQAEEVAVHLSEDFDAFYMHPLAPPQAGRDAGKLLAIGADGKGIVSFPGPRCAAGFLGELHGVSILVAGPEI